MLCQKLIVEKYCAIIQNTKDIKQKVDLNNNRKEKISSMNSYKTHGQYFHKA